MKITIQTSPLGGDLGLNHRLSLSLAEQRTLIKAKQIISKALNTIENLYGEERVEFTIVHDELYWTHAGLDDLIGDSAHPRFSIDLDMTTADLVSKH
jgi:hypothetical protein